MLRGIRFVSAEPRFVTPLRFQDDGGFPFTLLEDLVYITRLLPGRLTVRIPAGFRTDLASIPRFFWRVLPPIGAYDKAAVVHDFLYQHNGCSREQADAVLLEAMGVLGVGWATRQVIYRGVRLGGWKPWNAYRAKEAQ